MEHSNSCLMKKKSYQLLMVQKFANRLLFCETWWKIWYSQYQLVLSGARPPEPSTKGEPVHVLFFVKLPGCAPANPSNVFSLKGRSTKIIIYLHCSILPIRLFSSPLTQSSHLDLLRQSEGSLFHRFLLAGHQHQLLHGRVATTAALETWRFQPPQCLTGPLDF